ncbi:MAG: stalk domain-containing protein [Defluviitaleaceae bacterium]|nr:stalk domain-containing protein [Defluviitaleaceae bacterium]
MSQFTTIFKRLLAVMLMLSMVSFPVIAQTNQAGLGEISVYFNGRRMEFDQPPIIVNDRTMVPFRSIFEAFGAEVHWSQEMQQVAALHDIVDIHLNIGSLRAYIDRQPHYLDAAPFVTRDTNRTMVPIRFISEAFGADVDWDNDARNVIISTGPITIDAPDWEEVAGQSGLPDPDDVEELIYLGQWMRYDPSLWNTVYRGYYFNFYGFRISEASYHEAVAERNRILGQIIRPGMTEFDQVRAVHTWLANNVSYNHTSLNHRRGRGSWTPVRYQFEDQTAWAALVLRTAVCGGYADAFAFMMEPLGIDVYYISGFVPEYHAWNMVRVGGQWFHIDVTWARRNFDGYHLVIYDWFLISDNAVRTTGRSTRSWANTTTWQATSRPTAPATFTWNRPEPIWDHGLNQWRYRTPQDDITFRVNTSVSHAQGGSVTANPTSTRQGQWVTLQANANQGFEFSHFEVVSGGVRFHSQSGNWAQFLMPSNDVSIRAVFRERQQAHTVSISVNNAQWGMAHASPSGNVLQGNVVSLNASANQGFEFDRWEVTQGNANIQNINSPTTSFTMPSANVTIRAVFRQIGQTRDVTVSVNNAQWGTASANPNTNVSQDAWVSLQASANPGFEFERWEVVSGGAVIQNVNAASTGFNMPANNASVRAVFRQVQAQVPTHSVSVSTNNAAAGTAGATPNANIAQGATVNLQASANTGFQFERWEVVSGGVSIQNASFPAASFTMPAGNVSVRAVFREVVQAQTFSVTTSTNNAQWGTASATPNANLHGTGAEWVALQAIANQGFEFSHWEVVSGGASLQNSHSAQTQFLMPASNVSVRAVFREVVQVQTFSVSVVVNNFAAGTAWATPSSGLAAMDWVRIEAQANEGFEFSHWEVLSGGADVHITSSRSDFPMPASDVSVRAVFTQIPQSE